jgi:hypothetical protein
LARGFRSSGNTYHQDAIHRRAELDAAERVNRRRAVLGAADVDLPMSKVDGVPAQRHQFDRAQTMPVGQQHHGGVAMPIPVVSGWQRGARPDNY